MVDTEFWLLHLHQLEWNLVLLVKLLHDHNGLRDYMHCICTRVIVKLIVQIIKVLIEVAVVVKLS